MRKGSPGPVHLIPTTFPLELRLLELSDPAPGLTHCLWHGRHCVDPLLLCPVTQALFSALLICLFY